MANFLMPKCRNIVSSRKHKHNEVEEEEDKENNPRKKTKVETTTLTNKENRGVLHDRKNTNTGIQKTTTSITQSSTAPNTKKEIFQKPIQTSGVSRSKNGIVCRRSIRRTVINRWGYISPIPENKNAPLAVVIHQGIPDGRQKFCKKLTLSRSCAGSHSQGVIAEYFDEFYEADLLEDIISIYLFNQHGSTLKTNVLQILNACLSPRNAVINWLIQLQEYLNLPYQEIFTMVYLFDLVISRAKVATNMYQLIGIIILWIVTKTDDIVNCPRVATMLTLCKGVYTQQQFLKMEKKLLVYFDFKLNICEVTIFVIFYVKKLNLNNENLNMFLNCVHYVLECFTLNTMYSTTLPSIKAQAAVTLVMNTLRGQSCEINCAATLHNLKEVQTLVNEMLVQLQKVQDPRFPYRQPFIKYSSTQYSQASLVLLQNLVGS